ncbi:MAG: DUF1565 domain-containing protein, partial [Bacteroidales bacterium]|nr:DUF1565 domain-containing protein [Bacteroidales bacterium]
MKILLVYLFFLISINLSAQTGGVYFVAVDGDDNNPGTYTQPWATWNKAFATADAGDTVYFRGGVYYSYEGIYVYPYEGYGHSGTVSNPILYEGYPPDIAAGNFPILDCTLHCD